MSAAQNIIQNSSKTPVLSIIATFHHEGAIAYKTLQNIAELIQPLEQQGITYELLLHLDKGDAETRSYLELCRDYPHTKFLENNFGNPSDSRNFCIKAAKGKYLALLDGDDLISNNWLLDGYHMLVKSTEPLVLHAEYNITFGVDEKSPRIWHLADSRSKDEDVANLFTRNQWDAGIMLSRATALEHPYKSATHGYGYEDWTFNIDTRGAGILHKVVPHSVKFYRVRTGSIYDTHYSSHVVTAYSETFSTPNLQKLAESFNSNKLPIKSPNSSRRKFKKLTTQANAAGRKLSFAIPRVGNFFHRGFNHLDRQRGQKTFKNLPKHIQDAWIAANKIDGEAWPDPLRLGRLWTYDSDFNDLTALYCRLITQIRKDPDYLFLPPALSIGGTEKVLTNYLNAFAELHPDWHIVVLASLPEKHPYKIPDNVDFVDFYGIMRGRSWFETDFILSRFIVQTKVKRLHLIHNELAFLWAKNHLSLLADNNYKLYISQFMDEYNQDPRLIVGFVDPWIRDLAPAITKVFTDNAPFAATIQQRTGLPSEKVLAHFQPTKLLPSIMPEELDSSANEPDNSQLAKSPEQNSDRPLRILWASRVSPQKRPDLLKQIAAKLNPAKNECPAKYLIDAYGRTQRPYTSNFFADLAPTVTYQGTYNGIDSLDLSNYDAFLYTSQTDGLPNVLLEIASAGLPIVASNVGGVSDIVNPETGYPVDMDDIDGYVKALREIRHHPGQAAEKAAKARGIVKTRHSWPHFLNQIKRDID